MEWESIGSCASVHVSKNQLFCKQVNAGSSKGLDKALWEIRAEGSCMSQELGEERSCWSGRRWSCGEGWGWDRLWFPCGKIPSGDSHVVVWEEESRRRHSGVSFYIGGKGSTGKEKRPRAGLLGGVHWGGSWARKNFWDVKEMPWACLSSFCLLHGYRYWSLPSPDSEDGNEMCYWGVVFQGSEGHFW